MGDHHAGGSKNLMRKILAPKNGERTVTKNGIFYEEHGEVDEAISWLMLLVCTQKKYEDSKNPWNFRGPPLFDVQSPIQKPQNINVWGP